MVKWDSAADQQLLVLILNKHDIVVNAKAIAAAFVTPEGETPPTARAIQERVFKIRKGLAGTTKLSSTSSGTNKTQDSTSTSKSGGKGNGGKSKGSRKRKVAAKNSSDLEDHEDESHAASMDTEDDSAPKKRRKVVKKEVKKEVDLDEDEDLPLSPVPTPNRTSSLPNRSRARSMTFVGSEEDESTAGNPSTGPNNNGSIDIMNAALAEENKENQGYYDGSYGFGAGYPAV